MGTYFIQSIIFLHMNEYTKCWCYAQEVRAKYITRVTMFGALWLSKEFTNRLDVALPVSVPCVIYGAIIWFDYEKGGWPIIDGEYDILDPLPLLLTQFLG